MNKPTRISFPIMAIVTLCGGSRHWSLFPSEALLPSTKNVILYGVVRVTRVMIVILRARLQIAAVTGNCHIKRYRARYFDITHAWANRSDLCKLLTRGRSHGQFHGYRMVKMAATGREEEVLLLLLIVRRKRQGKRLQRQWCIWAHEVLQKIGELG